MRRKSGWLWHVLIALDQLGNALIGGAADETISSRAGRNRGKGKKGWDLLCKGLDWLDPNHCAGSIEEQDGEFHAHHGTRTIRELPNYPSDDEYVAAAGEALSGSDGVGPRRE